MGEVLWNQKQVSRINVGGSGRAWRDRARSALSLQCERGSLSEGGGRVRRSCVNDRLSPWLGEKIAEGQSPFDAERPLNVTVEKLSCHPFGGLMQSKSEIIKPMRADLQLIQCILTIVYWTAGPNCPKSGLRYPLPRQNEATVKQFVEIILDPGIIKFADILFSTAGMIGAIWFVARWERTAR